MHVSKRPVNEISILKQEAIIKNISYERCVDEFIDERNLS